VAEGARLESVCRGNSTVGSNPTLSAMLARPTRAWGREGLRREGFEARSGRPPRRPNKEAFGVIGETKEERCQSGRMGRSRKPLTAQAVRGFESHPLRHARPPYQGLGA
jgi:hypothetical protein